MNTMTLRMMIMKLHAMILQTVIQLQHDGTQRQHHTYDPPPRPSAPIPSAGDPVDLDRTFLNRMSSENREYCRAHNLGFYCKEHGHGIDNCEKMADAMT